MWGQWLSELARRTRNEYERFSEKLNEDLNMHKRDNHFPPTCFPVLPLANSTLTAHLSAIKAQANWSHSRLASIVSRKSCLLHTGSGWGSYERHDESAHRR